MSKATKIFIPLVILLGGFGLMWILLGMRENSPKKPSAPRPKIVSAELVKLQDLQTGITAYGRIRSAQPIEIYSEVSGVLMSGDIPYQPAQSFKSGDLIFRIDDRQAVLDLNSKKSELLNALAIFISEIKSNFPEDYKIWQNYFDNCGFNNQLPPLPEAADSRIKLFLSRFNVYNHYFAARDLEIQLEKHYYYAPFKGSVVSTNLRVGSTVRPGSLIGKIINLDDVEVETQVAVEELRWIDRSKPVEFTSSELSGKWSGWIKRIGSSVDDRTQTVSVFMSIISNARLPLIDGKFMEAKINGKIVEDSYPIPRRAVYGENIVYKVKNGLFESATISIAKNEPNSIIANGGLSDGDTLVVDVLQGVSPGMAAQARIVSSEEYTRK
jgi:multidrug efflux pump subunit AcrA (membrane-fusion protein)